LQISKVEIEKTQKVKIAKLKKLNFGKK